MKFLLKSLINGKEPQRKLEPDFVTLAPAGNLILAPRLRLSNTGRKTRVRYFQYIYWRRRGIFT
jgi:hypothetical protein